MTDQIRSHRPSGAVQPPGLNRIALHQCRIDYTSVDAVRFSVLHGTLISSAISATIWRATALRVASVIHVNPFHLKNWCTIFVINGVAGEDSNPVTGVGNRIHQAILSFTKHIRLSGNITETRFGCGLHYETELVIETAKKSPHL